MKILNSYKKIAKEFIKEAAWDRKFGEPLPTLSSVMEEASDDDKVIGKNDQNRDVTIRQAFANLTTVFLPHQVINHNRY